MEPEHDTPEGCKRVDVFVLLLKCMTYIMIRILLCPYSNCVVFSL